MGRWEWAERRRNAGSFVRARGRLCFLVSAGQCVRMSYPKIVLMVAALVAGGAGFVRGVESDSTFSQHVIGNSQIRVLPTAANGRDYQLYVALPYSYAANPGKRFPVLYLCDGYWDFTLLCGLYGNLIYDKVVPEFIIVGFGYAGERPEYDKLRRYDYTPMPHPEDTRAEGSGHAGEFLSVVEREIIPFVEKEYRAEGSYRVLAGSSLGGLFTLNAMFEKPGLFQAYIAVSPACEWAGGAFFKNEAAFAKTNTALNARLFMTAATEEWPELFAAVRRFDRQLAARKYAGFTYRFWLVEGERHGGTKPESYNRGVRFAFAPLVKKE